MENNIQKQSVSACKLLLDTTAQHIIEAEVMLPEYCPDIVRVLFAKGNSVITNCSTSGNTFMVEGMTTVKICYLAEVGGVRKTEYQIPFRKAFESKETPQSPVCMPQAYCGEISCRAASKRRLELGGEIKISLKVFDDQKEDAIISSDENSVMLKPLDEEGYKVSYQQNQNFSVEEILAVGVGKRAAAEILRVDCVATLTESKIAGNKFIIKGELSVHLLYKVDIETGELETADYLLPIGKMIDLVGVQEESKSYISLMLLSANCSLEEMGQEGDLRFEAELSAMVKMFSPLYVTAAQDGFSTAYESENIYKNISLLKECNAISQSETIKWEIPLEDGQCQCFDSFAEVLSKTTLCENGKVTVTANIKATAFVPHQEMLLQCVSQTAQVNFTFDCPAESCQVISDILIMPLTGQCSGDKLLLTAKVMLNGMLISLTSMRVLGDIKLKEDSPKSNDPSVGIMIYYAAKGEDVWDISKEFSANPAQVIMDNDLSGEILEENQPLIIPTM